jgi:hypothetical protein
MKRTSILLSVLLALAAFSHADSINLTSGSGKVYPLFVLPGFTFEFHGGGYDLSIPGAADDFSGGLVNCLPCNPLDQISSPLFIASGGIPGGLTSGDPFLTGQIYFNAVSFVSSLAPSGILTIKYTATPSIQLFLIDATTLEPTAGPFVWGNPNQPWIITARFTPEREFPGVYRFAGATLTSVPEPATITLLGTGMLPILFGVRRRLTRTRHGTPYRSSGAKS